MIETLKLEIIESQKSRLELFKWKLIISAGLGIFGLGIGPGLTQPVSTYEPIFSSMHLVLCIIPLACNYVDLLCVNIQLRMLVIGKFFEEISEKTSSEVPFFKLYEAYCSNHRYAYSLDDLAQFGSTIIVSSLIIAVGCIHWNQSRTFLTLTTFGALGMILTFLTHKTYRRLCAKL
jgi:hypothetical protein